MSTVEYKQLLQENLTQVDVNSLIERENEKDLSKILQELRQLNEINQELGFLLNNQGETLDNIENLQEEVIVNTEAANISLESAARKRIKFIPIVIGGVVGASILGPGALAFGAKGAAAYIAGAGGILGGIAGKSLS